MNIDRDHVTTYTEDDESGKYLALRNECDGTTNPFVFDGELFPSVDGYVDINTLRMMKRIIDRALREAKKVGSIEYVEED